jgi:hypothetical protein
MTQDEVPMYDRIYIVPPLFNLENMFFAILDKDEDEYRKQKQEFEAAIGEMVNFLTEPTTGGNR